MEEEEKINEMSKQRIKYILKEATGATIGCLVGTLILTGLVLFVGFILRQDWVFSAPLLILILIWNLYTTVRDAIRDSKGM